MKYHLTKITSGRSGFSLVELLVAIAIIAILSGLVLTVIDPQGKRRKARDTVRRSDIAVISSSLEQYYADNIAYPSVTSNDVGNVGGLYKQLDGSSGGKIYLKSSPLDPSGGSYHYCYATNASRTSYVICAMLESTSVNDLHGVTASQASSCGATSQPATGSGGYFCLTNPF